MVSIENLSWNLVENKEKIDNQIAFDFPAQEGGLILSGLTYDKKQNISYDVFNVDILRYETTSQFDGIIKSFNIQTNTWTAKYIYKRLKFLKSKVLSHLCSLLFLAIWHGHKSGSFSFVHFVGTKFRLCTEFLL